MLILSYIIEIENRFSGVILRGCVSMHFPNTDGFLKSCNELPDEICSICYGNNCNGANNETTICDGNVSNSANIETFSSMLVILVALLVARSGF